MIFLCCSIWKPDSRLWSPVMKRDECSESIYRGHSVFYLVMLPGLQCTIFLTSEDRNWKENSRDQTDKVNQKTTKRHALRCGESLRQTCSLVSAPPFLHLSPKQTCESPPGLQLSAWEEKNTGRWGEGGRGRERERERDKEWESQRENRWQALTKGRTLC